MNESIDQFEFIPGVIFENCGYHPCLCIEADYDSDYLRGISLIDGNIRGCSINNCGPRVISLDEAIAIKSNWINIQADIDRQMKEAGF